MKQIEKLRDCTLNLFISQSLYLLACSSYLLVTPKHLITPSLLMVTVAQLVQQGAIEGILTGCQLDDPLRDEGATIARVVKD